MWNPRITIQLPDWLSQYADGVRCESAEEKMDFAIRLAELNVENQTGGPFGAAVFEAKSGKLLAPGVNLVVPSNCSIAHAEILALAVAQQTIGSFDLSSIACVLATSTEPCAMCLGAIPWSGVSAVLCGARDEDARAVGFDEGVKPINWLESLSKQGIKVVRDILRDKAVAVLEKYKTAGGVIYNSGH